MSIEPPTGGQPPAGSPPPEGGGQLWYTRPLVIGGAVLAVVVAIIIVLVVALAGGDGDDNGEVVLVSPTAEGTGDGETDDLATFSNLVARADEALNDVRVAYSVRSVADGEVFEGEWVLAQRRPSDSRVEINLVDSQIIIITTMGPSYVCTVFEGQGSCFAAEASAAEAITAPVDALYAVPLEVVNIASQQAISTSRKTIADQSATCYTVDLPDAGEAEVCFSSDPNLLLRVRFEENLFEATSVGEPRDEDFECCPFEVVDPIEMIEPELEITVEPQEVQPRAR